MSDTDCQGGRPRRYQTGRGLWLKPLKVLVAYGRTDAEVAWVLARLTQTALRVILTLDDPTDEDVEALVSAGPVAHWTAGMVKWHRWRRRIASRVRREAPLARWWDRGHARGAS